jgi:hypothetical protein
LITAQAPEWLAGLILPMKEITLAHGSKRVLVMAKLRWVVRGSASTG